MIPENEIIEMLGLSKSQLYRIRKYRTKLGRLSGLIFGEDWCEVLEVGDGRPKRAIYYSSCAFDKIRVAQQYKGS